MEETSQLHLDDFW